ncbi:MAG: glycosyltransferase family 4 protein [Clostridia bacterium]|nr:glycosyltransferase family 4 protein [Clostridia bacterium]
MKILVVCQYYYPENFQITPICEQLAADGYDVTVLTGLPNYPTGIIPKEYRTGHRDEVINGVHVIRCHEIGRKKGAGHLALNYLSYVRSASKKVLELEEDFDLVLVYQLSPILMGIPGRKYAKKHNVPLLVYCCDLWPESMKMYIKNEKHPAFKLIKKVSKDIYDSADRIIIQSTSFLPYLKETHNIPDDKITYIPAFADETYLTQDFTPENDIVDFVFLGNLGIAQNLIAVLEAVEKIRSIPGFKVHFVGDGSVLEEMKKFVDEHKLGEAVVFYGRRPVEEMPKFYKLADACLVSLKADNATGLTLPSKVQGYMAAGKPIIGMIDGSAKDVIEESACGICVNAGDIDGLAAGMKDFIQNRDKYKNCGNNARRYFIDNFSKKKFMVKLENEIERLVNR